MKRTIIITLFLATFVPLMNICNGTSASAQYWADESGSLWNLADNTGQYGIQACQYCGVYVCGNSDEQLESNMKYHLFNCDAYLVYLAMQALEGGNNGDNSEDNSGDGNNSSNNSNNGTYNNSNNVYVHPVVDISQASSVFSQLGITYSLLNEYDNYYGYYVSYPYVSLHDFISFIRRYGATVVMGNTSYHYPFIGLYTNSYTILRNGVYLIQYNISTNYGIDYVYIFEF